MLAPLGTCAPPPHPRPRRPPARPRHRARWTLEIRGTEVRCPRPAATRPARVCTHFGEAPFVVAVGVVLCAFPGARGQLGPNAGPRMNVPLSTGP